MPLRSGLVQHRPLPSLFSFPLAVVVAAGVSACGESPPVGVQSLQVDTLASGVVRVTSPERGAWEVDERTGGWTLVEELRIGGDRPGPDLFGNIVALEATADGRILVLESQAAELRVFDADGTHLRTLGGPGEGPGELGRASGMALHPDDGSLWVASPNRFTVFEDDGSLRATHPRNLGFFQFPWAGGIGADGRLYDVVTPGEFTRLSDSFEPDGGFRIPEVEGSEPVRITGSDGTPIASITPWFAPRLHWSWDGGDHLWLAFSDGMTFFQTTMEGDTTRILTRSHTPVPVSAAEASAVGLDMGAATGQFGPNVRIEGDLVGGDTKPAFNGFLVDEVGRLWVDPARAEGGPRSVEVWSADGAFLGAIPVEGGFAMVSPRPVIRDRHLYAVVRDELGVPFVVRYRVEGM
ncbi:MAG: hypothetical protein EA422_14355 [Gemmatimonadales bacterium]|nr:MAG: hypothetical protein EA422_14355 [Gemmatimonadales bacterium]